MVINVQLTHTHTHKPQSWNVQDVKRERKKKALKTSIWSGSAESFTKTEVEKKERKKKNTLKHKVWLLRNASSQSVRTTGCIRGSRENKHWRMSFLHTWCLSQPQIPKFARDAAKPIHSRPTCDFYLIRVWILWALGCLYTCIRVTSACKVARQGRLNCAGDDFCTAAQSTLSCRDNLFGWVRSDLEGAESKLNAYLLPAQVLQKHSCDGACRHPTLRAVGFWKTLSEVK